MKAVKHLWGRWETVPVQGTERRARIYIPSRLGRWAFRIWLALFPILIFSARMPSWMGPVLLAVFYVFLVGDFMTREALPKKEYQRVLAGELVVRKGELRVLSELRTNISGSKRFRFLLLRHLKNGALREEIYEFSVDLFGRHPNYIKHMDPFHMMRRRGVPAYAVEVVVLPPREGEEFDASSPPRLKKGFLPGSRWKKTPISRARVIDVLYLEKLEYPCEMAYMDLFYRL